MRLLKAPSHRSAYPLSRLALLALLPSALLSVPSVQAQSAPPPRKLEKLNRGLIAVPSGGGYFLSWRLFGTESQGLAFNVYKGADKLNPAPITASTTYQDNSAGSGAYTVRPVLDGQEQGASEAARMLTGNYLTVRLSTLPGNTPNDATVADLDGDGEYEIVVKQEMHPVDNTSEDPTEETKLEAYKLNGALMWRINMGRNIREGAHYTQFMVYDLDGDGRAEVAVKTADGTVDGLGKVIGSATANHRNADNKILSGPEFFTIFDGRTGGALATVDYVPGRGNIGGWGGVGGNGGNDNNGNRVDRFTACIAYLDGVQPSVVMGRGYYGRSVLAAWDWRGGKLTQRWVFDSVNGQNPYSGQGAHGISVADVDADGKDEIIYGAMTVDDDGKGLYTTGFRHGDALHVGDLDPARPGLEVYMIHENEENAATSPGTDLHSARTGEVYFKTAVGQDVGRGLAADISAAKPGYEFWGSPSGVLDVNGQSAGIATPSSANFAIWWDGDVGRELLNGTSISKVGGGNLLSASGAAANNGTKSTPALTADIFGDWREEVIFRASNNSELRIYTTTVPTTTRMHTLMHDPVYRLGVAWQNVGYNQPPHVGFYLGYGMTPPPRPNIFTEPGLSNGIRRVGPLPSPSRTGLELLRGSAYRSGYRGNLAVIDLSGRIVPPTRSDARTRAAQGSRAD